MNKNIVIIIVLIVLIAGAVALLIAGRDTSKRDPNWKPISELQKQDILNTLGGNGGTTTPGGTAEKNVLKSLGGSGTTTNSAAKQADILRSMGK